MNYLYEAIQPTRLYIKQCPHCGLKYFGKSTREDIKSYRGSGTRWNNHLKKHKVAPLHLWNSDWYHDTSIKRFATKFSRINKIVSSANWANLKEENGLEGGFEHLNDGSKEHLERASLGGKNSTHNILGKGVMFSPNDERTKNLSKIANEAKKKKLEENPEYRNEYYSKVSNYQKTNNSMKDKCWCVPIDCKNKSLEMKVFDINEIPYGWISCKDFNEQKKDKSNPAYGKMWITNPHTVENRYINKNENIPDGWIKGRNLSFRTFNRDTLTVVLEDTK
jgi:hypothetical protein